MIRQQPFEVWQIRKICAQRPAEVLLFYQDVKMSKTSMEGTSRSYQIKWHFLYLFIQYIWERSNKNNTNYTVLWVQKFSLRSAKWGIMQCFKPIQITVFVMCSIQFSFNLNSEQMLILQRCQKKTIKYNHTNIENIYTGIHLTWMKHIDPLFYVKPSDRLFSLERINVQRSSS